MKLTTWKGGAKKARQIYWLDPSTRKRKPHKLAYISAPHDACTASCPLYDRARLSNEPLVLATVIRTGGSTYAKPGAQMLIAADGEYAGLLSGGCLEGDLREHAREVAASGQARIVSYDLRSTTDQLFGLGAGCEGAMDVLLTRVSAAEQWQPLATWPKAIALHREQRICLRHREHATPAFPLGSMVASGDIRRTRLRPGRRTVRRRGRTRPRICCC